MVNILEAMEKIDKAEVARQQRGKEANKETLDLEQAVDFFAKRLGKLARENRFLVQVVNPMAEKSEEANAWAKTEIGQTLVEEYRAILQANSLLYEKWVEVTGKHEGGIRARAKKLIEEETTLIR